MDEFRDRGVTRCGIFLLKPGDAIDLVEACRIRNIAILGIEGFYVLDNNKLQPDTAHNINFSEWGIKHFPEEHKVRWVRYRDPVEDSWAAAHSFLEARLSTPLYFEMVIDE
jgi:hypothetical protein